MTYDDGDEEELAKLQSFWKKALGHGLKYAAGLFAKHQDDDDDDDLAQLEDLFADQQDGDLTYDDGDEEELAKLQSFWKKALGHGLKYASGFFAKHQDDDDDDDLAQLEDLFADQQDGDLTYDDGDEEELAKLQSFWKKALGHGLKYAAGLFAKHQDDDDDDDLAQLEDLFADQQDGDLTYDDGDEEELAKLQSFWKKALGHGLKYASGFFAKHQDDDDDDDLAQLEDLFADQQDGDLTYDDGDEEELAKLQSFWKKALGHGLKYAAGLFAKHHGDDDDTPAKKLSLSEELLDRLSRNK